MKRVKELLTSRIFFLVTGSLIGSTLSYNRGFGWVHIIMILLYVGFVGVALETDEKERKKRPR